MPDTPFGNPPPMATLSSRKYPACLVMLAHVPASSWAWLMLWNCWSSTYQRSMFGLTLVSHSNREVWEADWHDAPGQAREAPRPLNSSHGPAGATPQCSTPQTWLSPLTFSM